MKSKYVNILVEGNGSDENIGVIDLGELDVLESETKASSVAKERLEPKLVEALKGHFDCPVKIIHTNVISIFGFIEIHTTVILEEEEEDRQTEVIMKETWVY